MTKQIIATGSKFIVVGVVSTAINYSVFYLLYNFLHTHYIVSSVSGYVSGILLGFILNNSWTFEEGRFNVSKFLGYIAVYLLSLGISSLFLWITVYFYHVNVLLANFFAICISTVTNFLGLNYIIYKRIA